MYDDFLLDGKFDSVQSPSSNDLDSLFDNLTNDIDIFNRYVDDVNKQRKENSIEEKELIEEKERIERSKKEFEEYIKTKNDEYDKKISQIDDYLNTQKQNLLKLEVEFKTNMDNSLNELEIAKKEFEMQKEKFNEQKEQFETYKNLELERINHSKEIFESDRNQFEKYKEISTKKIELENKNLEQKCDKFKELIGQFNSKFKPIITKEEGV